MEHQVGGVETLNTIPPCSQARHKRKLADNALPEQSADLALVFNENAIITISAEFLSSVFLMMKMISSARCARISTALPRLATFRRSRVSIIKIH